MTENTNCPKCASEFTYDAGSVWSCTQCFHEWDPNAPVEEHDEEHVEDTFVVKDANGNLLQDGDDVIVIKDLPVKGAPKPVKAGTKVRNIRLVDSDHNIDCRIDGFGAMALKSEFVRKA